MFITLASCAGLFAALIVGAKGGGSYGGGGGGAITLASSAGVNGGVGFAGLVTITEFVFS